MQESQDNTADSVGLMIRLLGLPFFCYYGRKDTILSDDALSLKIGSTAQNAVISSLSL